MVLYRLVKRGTAGTKVVEVQEICESGSVISLSMWQYFDSDQLLCNP